MSSVGAGPAGEPKLNRLFTWFDPETAAGVTILLGLYQVLLSVPLASAGLSMPSIFILPLVTGILVVAGGSLTVANEKNPSRLLLRFCVYSNMASLLGSTVALCLYCYSLSKPETVTAFCPIPTMYFEHRHRSYKCPGEILAAFNWNLILLLLIYDAGAVLMHCVLSVSALRALKTA
ncbi:uncharacterized protein si:dkey-9i23.16 [Notolabrus celidotus]|uniref:uncharacterized protein si:dkey-9i23.16 n=1 Tax=Notolabrus celidotus TaxID=1203425 RepID=UPI001490646A|nr:uncharacterized protein si:dkey-9i23.16 [Notolabrus celidotus]